MEENYIKKYYETYYQTERDKFLDQITEYVIQNREQLVTKLYQAFETFALAVGKGQEEYPCMVECIQISLLRVSMYQENPMLHFDAYGELGVLGLHLFRQAVPFSWITAYWKEFKERLKEDVVQMKATRYISEARLQQMMLESLEMVENILYGLLKYPFSIPEQIAGLSEVMKTEHFYISFGSYMDRQRALAAEFGEVDIFLHEKEESLSYRIYESKIYSRKEFKELKLFHSQFKECQFINCVFSNSDLKDTVFEGCRFYKTEFKDCQGAGITIHDSLLESVTFENIIFYYQGEESGMLQGIYKPLDILESQIDKMEMKHCDIRYARLTDNDVTDMKFIECNVQHSTMEGKIDEDGVFQALPEQEDE